MAEPAKKCLFCSDCIKTCTTGTIKEAKTGFRVLAGGKLGRHPRLGRYIGEISGLVPKLLLCPLPTKFIQAHNPELIS